MAAAMNLRRTRCGDSVVILGFCFITSTFVATLLLYEYLIHSCNLNSRASAGAPDDNRSHHPPGNNDGPHDTKTTPLIFIGGWPRSGTTLMRVMLDAHPDVRCGEETHLIPQILTQMMSYRNTTSGAQRLLEAGITEDVLFSAIASFILEVIVRHAEAAGRLCNKDPFTLGYAIELNKMFPRAQFVLMIRDGRAVCHSIAFRNVGISGMDPKNLTNCLTKWNASVKKMYNDCLTLGRLKCLPVRYEQLVLHPRSVLTEVLVFLKVPWNDVVLHHEKEMNKPGGISLSRLEPSTDQVIKPVNIDSLTKWSTFIPDDVKQQMRKLAPMLEILGYDPGAYPPNYGHPDKEVEENTLLVQKNEPFFKQLAWEARNRTKVLDQ